LFENIDFFWWTEAEISTATDLEALIDILAADASEGANRANLETATLDALSLLAQNTSSEFISRRIDGILAPYGLGDPNYLEPVFLPGQFKASQPLPNRAKKPVSTFTAYPNPTTGKLVIQWKWLEEGLDGPMTCHVRNLNGQIVYSTTIKDYAKNTSIVDLSKLANGMYFIEASTENGRVLFKEKISVLK
jgi:hypothetical protein